MTVENGKDRLSPFMDKCERDKDAYFIVHFSKESDYYAGYHDGMDEFDALILLRHLVKEFKLTDAHLDSVMDYDPTQPHNHN